MKSSIFVFKLPGEGKESKMRLWRWNGRVKGPSAFDAITKYALIRVRDCAQSLEFKISENEQFQLIRSGVEKIHNR